MTILICFLVRPKKQPIQFIKRKSLDIRLKKLIINDFMRFCVKYNRLLPKSTYYLRNKTKKDLK